jgi:hypothetical protein
VGICLLTLVLTYVMPMVAALRVPAVTNPLPRMSIPLVRIPTLTVPKLHAAPKPAAAPKLSSNKAAAAAAAHRRARKAVKRRVPVITDKYTQAAAAATTKKSKADPFAKVPIVEDMVGAPPIILPAAAPAVATAPKTPAPAASATAGAEASDTEAPTAVPAAIDPAVTAAGPPPVAPQDDVVPVSHSVSLPLTDSVDGGKADGSIQLFSVADASTPVDPASTPKLPDVKPPVETEPKPAVKEIVAPAPPAVPLGTPDPSLDQTVKANTTADLSGAATCTSTGGSNVTPAQGAAGGGGTTPPTTGAPGGAGTAITGAADGSACAKPDPSLPSLDPAATPGSGPSPPAAWTVTLTGASANTISIALRGSDLVVTVDGVETIRALALVTSLTVSAGAGDDSITLADGLPVSLSISIDGGDGADSLFGPGADRTWTVTAAGVGSVGSVAFAGFENLRGAAGNKDTFVFETAGTIAGVVDGGAGGFDSLVLGPGSFGLIAYTVTGPQSGTIARDADLITFAGLEPITVHATGAVQITVANPGTTDSADTIRSSTTRPRTRSPSSSTRARTSPSTRRT